MTNADKEVEDALKVKSEFIANVTHELRTPVNGILGNTMELLEKEEAKDKIRLLLMVPEWLIGSGLWKRIWIISSRFHMKTFVARCWNF